MELIRSSQGHLSVPSSNYPSRHKRSISQTPRKHLACHTFEKSVHGQSHNTFPSRDQRLVQPENPKSQPNASVKEAQGIHQVAQALTQQVPSNESSVVVVLVVIDARNDPQDTIAIPTMQAYTWVQPGHKNTLAIPAH